VAAGEVRIVRHVRGGRRIDLETQLRDIYAQHQELTPELVVATATDPDHPLHARFVSDDATAGHQYRLVQAQLLIRSVEVELIVPERQEPIRVRAFVAETGRRRGTARPRYLPTDRVLMADGTREALLRFNAA